MGGILFATDGTSATRKLVGLANVLSVHEAYGQYAGFNGYGAPLPTLSQILQKQGSARTALLCGFGLSAAIASTNVSLAGPGTILVASFYVATVQKEPWHTCGAIVGFSAMCVTAVELGILNAGLTWLAPGVCSLVIIFIRCYRTCSGARVEVATVSIVSFLLMVA
jgi:hypothetical protein